MLRKLVVLCGLMLLGACTGQVQVPPVTVDTPTGIVRTPGQYAAMVQSGGWALKTDSQSWACSAWSFDTNINSVYSDAVRDALTRSLEKVTFVPNTLTPKELHDKGYQAQIVVYQGNAKAKFGVASGFFTGTANSEIDLTATLAILGPNGLKYQQSITGKGTGSHEVFTCNTIGTAVGAAAQDAVKEVVKDIVLYVRDGLNQMRPATGPQAKR